MTEPIFPELVFTLWWIGLLGTLVVGVPVAIYSLHRTLRAAQSIRRYADEALTAAQGIASNTARIAALETTLAVAGEMVATASAVEQKLGVVADVLGQRAGTAGT